jgi:hypothetical protein
LREIASASGLAITYQQKTLSAKERVFCYGLVRMAIGSCKEQNPKKGVSLMCKKLEPKHIEPRYINRSFTHRKEFAMTLFTAIVVLALMLIFVPISLLSLFSPQDDNSLVQMHE